MSKVWKEYMLECQIVKEEITQERFFFDTQEEMIDFTKNGSTMLNIKPDEIRIKSAFKLEKLDSNIFVED